MASAVGKISRIDPRACRDSVAYRYDVATVAEDYEAVYTAASTETARNARSGLGLELSIIAPQTRAGA